MEKLAAKKADEGREKHVPVIEKSGDTIKVKVGSIPHPMEEKHRIEWIELLAGDRVCRQFLKPGDAPEAAFCPQEAAVSAREHCNIHGLWEG
jgi:superoxide reductase